MHVTSFLGRQRRPCTKRTTPMLHSWWQECVGDPKKSHPMKNTSSWVMSQCIFIIPKRDCRWRNMTRSPLGSHPNGTPAPVAALRRLGGVVREACTARDLRAPRRRASPMQRPAVRSEVAREGNMAKEAKREGDRNRASLRNIPENQVRRTAGNGGV